MDDLNQMINQIMSDPESVKQLQSIASSLGLSGDMSSGQPAAAVPAASNQPDLSQLASVLGSLGQQQPPPPPPASPDLSVLASLLGGLNQQPKPPPQPDLSSLSGILSNLTKGSQNESAGLDVSALTALLNGGNKMSQPASGVLPNIDISTIMKLSQALSSIQSNKANVDLLLALKPRLKEERSKKIDDAIRVMQLIQFLPLIKESGLFGEMDKILGGFGNSGGSGGGLGGLLGNVGNGIGGLFSGLGRR